MLLPLHEFCALAYRQYQDFAALRAKDRRTDGVVENEHDIVIPPSLTGRATPIHAGIASEKASRAVEKLIDPRGVQHVVSSFGLGQKAGVEREKTQNWLAGVWQQVEKWAVEAPMEMAAHDIVVHDRGALRVLPHFAAWQGMPDPETELNLDDVDSTDDVLQRVSQVLTAQDKRKRRRLPILVECVPSACLWPEMDPYGIAVMWDFRQMTVRSLLETYVDEQGEPLACDLAASVERNEITDADVCNVVIRSDREHVQIVIVQFLYDDMDPDQRQHGGEEVVWEGPHGMGTVPYAYAVARVRPASSLAKRYHGLLDDVLETCVAHDWFVTQIATGVRFAMWPEMQVVPHQDTPPPVGEGQADEPRDFRMREGEVFYGLQPGEELKPIPWFAPGSLEFALNAVDRLVAIIDRQTIGPASYGTQGATSGYEKALDMVGAESPLEPFGRALASLVERADDLMLRAARALIREGCGPIPVMRRTDDSGIAWETLTEDLAEQDWEISVNIRPREAGGDMARGQVAAFLEARGYVSHTEAMTMVGNRNPSRTEQQILLDKLKADPQVWEFIKGKALQRFMAAEQVQPTPRLPENPVLSQPAANVFQRMSDRLPEDIRARLPQPWGEPLSTPGAGGLEIAGVPNPGAGAAAGQAQALPGGLDRVAQTLR